MNSSHPLLTALYLLKEILLASSNLPSVNNVLSSSALVRAYRVKQKFTTCSSTNCLFDKSTFKMLSRVNKYNFEEVEKEISSKALTSSDLGGQLYFTPYSKIVLQIV